MERDSRLCPTYGAAALVSPDGLYSCWNLQKLVRRSECLLRYLKSFGQFAVAFVVVDPRSVIDFSEWRFRHQLPCSGRAPCCYRSLQPFL